jgi:hypothetical protein
MELQRIVKNTAARKHKGILFSWTKYIRQSSGEITKALAIFNRATIFKSQNRANSSQMGDKDSRLRSNLSLLWKTCLMVPGQREGSCTMVDQYDIAPATL